MFELPVDCGCVKLGDAHNCEWLLNHVTRALLIALSAQELIRYYCVFLMQGNIQALLNVTLFKRQYVQECGSDTGFKGTVVTRAFSSLCMWGS